MRYPPVAPTVSLCGLAAVEVEGQLRTAQQSQPGVAGTVQANFLLDGPEEAQRRMRQAAAENLRRRRPAKRPCRRGRRRPRRCCLSAGTMYRPRRTGRVPWQSGTVSTWAISSRRLPCRVPGKRSTRLPVSPPRAKWGRNQSGWLPRPAPASRRRRAMNFIASPSWPLGPEMANRSRTKDSAFSKGRQSWRSGPRSGACGGRLNQLHSSQNMRFFLAGIMQGSHAEALLHDQEYRARIKRSDRGPFSARRRLRSPRRARRVAGLRRRHGAERVLPAQSHVPRDRRAVGLRARGVDGHGHRNVGGLSARGGGRHDQPLETQLGGEVSQPRPVSRISPNSRPRCATARSRGLLRRRVKGDGGVVRGIAAISSPVAPHPHRFSPPRARVTATVRGQYAPGDIRSTRPLSSSADRHRRPPC